MPREEQVFKVRIEFEQEDGVPVHEPLTVAVTRNTNIRTAQDAVNYCTAIIGQDETGKDITRIHYKENATGLFFSIVKCDPVSETPFARSQAPVIRSLASAPQPPKAE